MDPVDVIGHSCVDSGFSGPGASLSPGNDPSKYGVDVSLKGLALLQADEGAPRVSLT